MHSKNRKCKPPSFASFLLSHMCLCFLLLSLWLKLNWIRKKKRQIFLHGGQNGATLALRRTETVLVCSGLMCDVVCFHFQRSATSPLSPPGAPLSMPSLKRLRCSPLWLQVLVLGTRWPSGCPKTTLTLASARRRSPSTHQRERGARPGGCKALQQRFLASFF